MQSACCGPNALWPDDAPEGMELGLERAGIGPAVAEFLQLLLNRPGDEFLRLHLGDLRRVTQLNHCRRTMGQQQMGERSADYEKW